MCNAHRIGRSIESTQRPPPPAGRAFWARFVMDDPSGKLSWFMPETPSKVRDPSKFNALDVVYHQGTDNLGLLGENECPA